MWDTQKERVDARVGVWVTEKARMRERVSASMGAGVGARERKRESGCA